jgi:predicted PurR-regulated permease PerM
MDDNLIKKQSKYFFIACFFIILVVAIYMIRSYIITIISATLLSYIFYPLYKKIKAAIRNDNISSLITTMMVVIIIIIPLVFTANALINQSIDFLYSFKDIDITKVETFIGKYLGENVEIEEYTKDLVNKFTLYVAKTTSDFVVSLPKRIIDFFVMLFMMFYLFKGGPKLIERMKEHIPLKDIHKKHIARKFNGIVYASLYGLVLTAFIQGAVGALGLWIFDVPSPLLWGLVMIVLSMLPVVGTGFVWFPAALYKIFTDDTFNGFGLLLYGIFIVSTIDNIIRPKIVGAKGKIHPIMVLLGVLGGIQVFGILGIILGPLILAILSVFLDIFLVELRH